MGINRPARSGHIAREILEDAAAVDAQEDERFGDARDDGLRKAPGPATPRLLPVS
jgi:hypothetical protein